MKHSALFILALVLTATCAFAKKNQEEIPLNARGTELHEQYTKELETLRAEVVAEVTPAIDETKKAAFVELRAKWDAIPRIGDDTKPDERKAIEASAEQIQAESIMLGESLIADLTPVLASDKLDSKLMRIAILNHGTPRGLAEFAQQGAAQEKLLEQFFADEALMRQVLEAGGANGGDYGEMMEVYTAILAASERARERGTIYQRLALGMAMQMPWSNGKPESGVHGIVYRTR